MSNCPAFRKRMVKERMQGKLQLRGFTHYKVKRALCPECGKIGTHFVEKGIVKHKSKNLFGSFKETTYCQIKKSA